MPPRRSTRSKGTNKAPDAAPAPSPSLAVDIGDSRESESAATSPAPVGTRKVKAARKTKHEATYSSDEESPPKKRKTQPGPPRAPKHNPVFSIDLLLKLPFDLVAEICSHLNGGELLQLSRTCKTLYKFLLGPQSSSIWAASRLRRKLPLPDNTTEQQLASLLHDDQCFECGEVTMYPADLFLRCLVCNSCKKNLVVIKGSKIRNGLKGLHPQARNCVRFDPGHTWAAKPQATYLVRDLWAVSTVLYDLAEQDALAKQAIKASSRSKRAKGNLGTAADSDKLDKFLEEKKEWVKKEQEMSIKLRDAIQAEKVAFQHGRIDELKRAEEEHTAKIDSINRELEMNHGWTRAQLDWHHRASARAPRREPADDPSAWATFRDVVQLDIDRRAAIVAAAAARQARLDSVKPYYESFKAAQLGVLQNVVPELRQFVEWTSVKPLWEPDTAASLSDRIWACALPAIRQNFADYQEALRVAAIRAILKATTGKAPTSTDPTDYPESTYNEDWFQRPTAHFFGEMVTSPPGYRSRGPCPYPDTLYEHKCYGSRVDWFGEHIDAHQVRLVRLVLKGLGETEDSVTLDMLCELGAVWRWKNTPYKVKKEKERRYRFTELIYALQRRGPKPAQLARGENVPEIGLWDDAFAEWGMDMAMEEAWAMGLGLGMDEEEEECWNEAALEDPGCG
ncbi:hypothetical protein JCM3775_005349 [Rhodotorula graminis]